MIKINKDLNDIPPSLLSQATHAKRKEVIIQGEYDKHYDNYYKPSDVKDKLYDIYHGKCAYCEWRVEKLHVEHFRPKTIYYWLAFSWDNLLLACPTCNIAKSYNFPTTIKSSIKPPVCDNDDDKNCRLFNNLSEDLNSEEQPLLINPELDDPTQHITYSENGEIHSNDPRYDCTINICKLNRPQLVTERKKILNDFVQKVQAELFHYKNQQDQEIALSTCIRGFNRDAADTSKPFTGFQTYVKQFLLNSILKKIIPTNHSIHNKWNVY